MIRYDESEFEAGTDNPCYQDDNITIKCNWQDEDAYPFGYWEVNFDGEEKFIVGDNGSMHSNACGKAAREYFVSCYMSEVEEDAEIVDDAIDELLDTVNYSHLKEGASCFIETTCIKVSLNVEDVSPQALISVVPTVLYITL